jgi:CTP synthase
MVELADHPWFVGCQFHPELKSRPNRPHPLFAGFVGAAAARSAARRGGAAEGVPNATYADGTPAAGVVLAATR